MTRETIAIVGAEQKSGSFFAAKLIGLDEYRILLMPGDSHIPPGDLHMPAGDMWTENEAVTCIKDGCWEADTILLDVAGDQEKETADKIREVSTQKIVLILPDAGSRYAYRETDWDELLPTAAIVHSYGDPHQGRISISGHEKSATDKIDSLLKKLGFETVIK
ncbi:MAG TPA: hypothetical protein VG890_14640 [Puia sp.]|nr:hypothetical protein [Puia sp.]